MKKLRVACIALYWLIVTNASLSAQSYLGVSDYQRIKCEMMAVRPFQSCAWVEGSCRNDYWLKELTQAKLDAMIRYDRHAFMLQLSHDGYSRYGELTTSVGYAVKLGGRVAVGMRYYYLYQHVDHYEAQHSITFDVSLYAQLSKKLCFGFEVYNPARLRYSIRGPDIIPMRFAVVAHYLYGDKLSFLVQLFKKMPGKFDVQLGAFYRPKDFFYLNFAVSLYDADVGVMLRCRSVYFMVDMRYNYNLGCSPQVEVLLTIPCIMEKQQDRRKMVK